MSADEDALGTPAAPGDTPPAEPIAAAMDYQMWGWSVTLRCGQVSLSLDNDHAVALIIPTDLASAVAGFLTRRRCPIPVLAHPRASRYRVLLAGRCAGVLLPWPPEVQRTTGSVLLPPTRTARGPLRWQHPPRPNSLRLCREIDVLFAISTAQRDQC